MRSTERGRAERDRENRRQRKWGSRRVTLYVKGMGL